MSERTNLETHVELCELRYTQLDTRMGKIEQQMTGLNKDVQDLKDETRAGFAEIKSLIEKKQGSSYQSLIAASATVIVSLVGFLGYLLTHLK